MKRLFVRLFLVIVTSLLITCSFSIYQGVKAPNILVHQEDQYLIVPDTSFQVVKDSLNHKNYIKNLLSFEILAKVMGYEQNVKPGLYLLEGNMTNLDAIRLLRSGNQTPVKITFNNVRLLSELAEKMCKNIQLSAHDFEEVLTDSLVISNYGFDRASFISMFIPNTYEVYWTISRVELLDRMHLEYNKFWTPERRQKAEALKLNPTEISTLASMVQAEQLGHADERPRIAGLYLNRLSKKMKLDSDPTLIFAIGDFDIKRVLDKDKEMKSPYNTYLNKGLPPGPINLPSINSIDAVLNYEAHNYLYMCAKEDFSGYHNFATDLTQHIRNARLFQNELNRLRVYR